MEQPWASGGAASDEPGSCFLDVSFTKPFAESDACSKDNLVSVGLSPKDSFSGLRMADVGAGGGILVECLARLGAKVDLRDVYCPGVMWR